MTPDLERLVAPIRARAASAALLFDFDGTLSPTVLDPAAAAPAPGVADLLDRLADRYRTVAVVSGRPVAFLTGHLPSRLTLSGQYGLELRRDGREVDDPDVARWRTVVGDAVAAARAAAVPGARVEPKGLTFSIHYRGDPQAEEPVAALAGDLAGAHGLVVHPAKQSVELRPPGDADKGRVVRHLAADATAVVYVGDDVGDLPAVLAVAERRTAGAATLTAAVDGPELPPALREAADVVLPGVDGVVGLLRALAGDEPPSR